jgi:molybdopterin-containing oxidoreductase family iron-sulfur binding subunit
MMNTKDTKQLDVAAVRERLANKSGQQFWRSLEEAGESEEFREFLGREFPRYASEMRDPATRRSFLKLMGASLALAGLSGCQFALRQPEEKIVPYVRLPEGLIPGKPLFFATAIPFNGQYGYGTGLIVESHEGRPTKIEGNPDHPASLGATDALIQASILTMYDPDRSQFVTNAGTQSTWGAFLAALAPALADQRNAQGAGMRILTETITSPTLTSQIQALLEDFPQARWVQYDPINRDNVHEGARLAFGEDVDTQYVFSEADIIVSLDADFLGSMPGHVRYARDFSTLRRVRSDKKEMNRLYVVESTPSITGSMADHREALRPTRIAGFASSLAAALGVEGVTAEAGLPEAETRLIQAMVEDLQAHQGRSVVIAGDQQPPFVHALAHAMNAALGNVGATVIYTDPVEANLEPQTAALATLANEMAGGQAQLLLILGGNPVYNAPADLNFGAGLANVPFSAHLSLYEDETSAATTWHIPATHFLETWSDVRAFDGTVSIVQPLIAPIYGGKSAHELIAALQGQPELTSNQIVRQYWQEQNGRDDFERFWQRSLNDGIIAETGLQPRDVTLQTGFTGEAPAAEQGAGALDIVFSADPSAWDGSYANNGWMQELPRPLTKIVWDNPALISRNTANALNLQNGSVVTLTYAGRELQLPVWIMPGQPDDTVTVTLGYGRERAGIVGNGVGFNTYVLRGTEAPWFASGATMQGTGAQHQLVSTQEHFTLEESSTGLDRTSLLRTATIEEFNEEPEMIKEMGHDSKESIYPEYDYSQGYKWGMTIDLNTCIGCNACTVACQAENNIPIVGKSEVAKSREMHWIRIDRYYSGNPDVASSIRYYHQPLPCMQCEKAPCEVVCPVAATVHDGEGLNNMVYNRCVGTKYCSNNCPYKVRRFNFLQYTDETTPIIQLQRNPNVTVRSRGVMEKCTYCVQRINAARQLTKVENRTIQDGEVLTACQQVCPTQAIVFGDLNTPGSQVATLQAEKHNYKMLNDLTTQPRTTYLARFSNPNPTLETE